MVQFPFNLPDLNIKVTKPTQLSRVLFEIEPKFWFWCFLIFSILGTINSDLFLCFQFITRTFFTKRTSTYRLVTLGPKMIATY